MSTNATPLQAGHGQALRVFDFIPADTLFFRDPRPLQAGSSYGRGAHWPLPTVLHSAIRTALLQANGELPLRKSQDGHQRRGTARGQVATEAYQWLNLRGPFPVDEKGVMYFPIPRDLVPDGDGTVSPLRIIPNPGGNNLPKALSHMAVSVAKPSKEALADWVSAAFYEKYLSGGSLAKPPHATLWDSDYRMGVAIDPDTHTAKEGQLYAAEHLRLRDGVKLRFAISQDPHGQEIANLAGRILQLGGERRFGRIAACDDEWRLPFVTITGNRVKWVLLAPAIFLHGWRPGWIGDDGNVLLRVVNGMRAKRRHERDHTAGWEYNPHKYGDQPIQARLVAACVGKPQVVGGWDDQPKPTYLAVPSGSVYYFRADSETEAQKLVRALQGRCKSDFFGEKGLGLGVCGTWQEERQ